MDKQIRTAILTLAAKGRKRREIARAVWVSRGSVKRVLVEQTAEARAEARASWLDEYIDDVRALHAECRDDKGRPNLVRVMEKLRDKLKGEGKALEVGYSTLTWFCRVHGIGVKEKKPWGRIVTDPGEEMQHDTSPCTVKLGERKYPLQCASLVLGYSRMLYVHFYPRFQRFHMKVFLTDAFTNFGGCCRRCVIDNTSTAIACGSGRRARMAAEVEAFEERFGFRFLAHEIMHSDRKGKIENPFGWVQRNFLVGRKFSDLADLNRQALEWCEMTRRKVKRDLKASPLELFAAEKPHLVPLPIYVPEVYRTCWRIVDGEGRVSLDAYKYPVPGPGAYIGKELMLRETKDRVIVLDGNREVATHEKRVLGQPQPPLPRPASAPRQLKATKSAEEDKLKALGEPLGAYLEALKTARGPRYFWNLRKLWKLLCHYQAEDLKAAVAKAQKHRVFDAERVETILLQDLGHRDYQLPLRFEADDFKASLDYRQGAVAPETDLKDYVPGGDKDAR